MQSLFRKSYKRKDQAPERAVLLKQVAYGFLGLLFLTFIGTAFWYVARLPMFTIQTIEVRGGKTIAHDEIRSLVDETLTGSYLLVVPYRHIYFYPKDHIVERVMRIPRVKEVTLLRTRTTLEVSFEEYTPSALWCVSPEARDRCFFISEDGYAFASAPPLRGETLVRHFLEGRDTLEEGQVLDTRTIETTEAFRKILMEQFGFLAPDITHLQSGDVVYHLSGGGDLITSSDILVAETAENLATILESEEFKHLKPGNFRYVDLRFGLKVYVNESLETASTTSTSTTPLPATSTEVTATPAPI